MPEKTRAAYEAAVAKGDAKTEKWVEVSHELGFEGAGVFLILDGHVVMFVHSQNDTVEYPAGKPKRGDKNPKQTAIRECKEETGFEPDEARLIFLGEIHGGTTGYPSLAYACRITQEELLLIEAYLDTTENEEAPFNAFVLAKDPMASSIGGFPVRKYVQKYVLPVVGEKLLELLK